MKESTRKYIDLEYDIEEIKEKLMIADKEYITSIQLIKSGVSYESDRVIITILKYKEK